MSFCGLSTRFKNKRRSKRLQKKLHLNDFKEMGFYIHIDFLDTVPAKERNDFFDKFIEECIEKNDLILGGSYHKSFICKEKGTCVLNDRLIVCEYLGKHTDILSATVTALIDCWYGPFED